MQTMTIQPFQNTIITSFADIFRKGGWGNETELYFDQLTPLAILSETADETGETIEEVEETVNDQMENTEQMENELEFNNE